MDSFRWLFDFVLCCDVDAFWLELIEKGVGRRLLLADFHNRPWHAFGFGFSIDRPLAARLKTTHRRQHRPYHHQGHCHRRQWPEMSFLIQRNFWGKKFGIFSIFENFLKSKLFKQKMNEKTNRHGTAEASFAGLWPWRVLCLLLHLCLGLLHLRLAHCNPDLWKLFQIFYIDYFKDNLLIYY